MPAKVGLIIIYLGIALIIVGIVVWTGALSWFGNLPGDIKIERQSTKVYIPVTSMLLISVVISLILYIFKKFY